MRLFLTAGPGPDGPWHDVTVDCDDDADVGAVAAHLARPGGHAARASLRGSGVPGPCDGSTARGRHGGGRRAVGCCSGDRGPRALRRLRGTRPRPAGRRQPAAQRCARRHRRAGRAHAGRAVGRRRGAGRVRSGRRHRAPAGDRRAPDRPRTRSEPAAHRPHDADRRADGVSGRLRDRAARGRGRGGRGRGARPRPAARGPDRGAQPGRRRAGRTDAPPVRQAGRPKSAPRGRPARGIAPPSSSTGCRCGASSRGSQACR